MPPVVEPVTPGDVSSFVDEHCDGVPEEIDPLAAGSCDVTSRYVIEDASDMHAIPVPILS